MPIRTIVCMLVVAALFSLPARSVAQPSTAGEATADPQATYDQAADAYKQVFKQIETLRAEYQNAEPARRQAINAELPELLNQARERMHAWTAAALEQYKANPNEDPQVSELLVGMAKYFVVGETPPGATGGAFAGGDQYEAAMPLLEALIAGNHPDKNVLVWAGFAATCTNDYEAAEKYFADADEAGAFDNLRPTADMKPEDEFMFKAYDFYQNIGDLRAMWQAEETIRTAEAAADDLPRVKFTTSKGDIVVELFENEAPIATANMISLVKQGFYNGVVFHRVLPHFMAQGGDPTGTGSGGPGYSIACECYEPDARNHFRGTLSMAHAGRDTGGSQFFLCFIPTSMLNGRHTAFGRVVEGMEVLGKLTRVDPQAMGPKPKVDKIITAEVLRDRGHEYAFEKLPGR